MRASYLHILALLKSLLMKPIDNPFYANVSSRFRSKIGEPNFINAARLEFGKRLLSARAQDCKIRCAGGDPAVCITPYCFGNGPPVSQRRQHSLVVQKDHGDKILDRHLG